MTQILHFSEYVLSELLIKAALLLFHRTCWPRFGSSFSV